MNTSFYLQDLNLYIGACPFDVKLMKQRQIFIINNRHKESRAGVADVDGPLLCVWPTVKFILKSESQPRQLKVSRPSEKHYQRTGSSHRFLFPWQIIKQTYSLTIKHAPLRILTHENVIKPLQLVTLKWILIWSWH